jgi:hypothetical protein
LNRKLFGITGADLLFVFQIVMAWVFAIPQCLRFFESTEGVTINWFLCAYIFIVLNLYLSYGTYRKVKSKETLQAFLIYLNWGFLGLPLVVISFLKCPWISVDTYIFSAVMILAGVVTGVGYARGRNINDPTVKGLLVGLFRVVPHVYMSWCIIQAGSGEGIATKAIWAANITASTRIITLVFSGRKAKWEKGVVASLLSEIANESSWMLVTIIWLIH